MCTRILWKNNVGVFSGRSMDWPESTHPVLTVLPRGMKRDGGLIGGGGERAGYHPELLCAVRGALRRLRHLQHRVPHGDEPYQPPLLLRTDHQPQCGVGRPRQV